jgi:hypothetical protein
VHTSKLAANIANSRFIGFLPAIREDYTGRTRAFRAYGALHL